MMMGPHLDQNYLVMHTSSPLFKPHVRTPQMTLGVQGGEWGGATKHLHLFLFSKVTTLNTSPFSAWLVN